MARVQSLVQWDPRRAPDAEVLADLCTHPARDRGRRLRELALLGLRAERGGGSLVQTPGLFGSPSPDTASRQATHPAPVDSILDDLFGDMLSNLDG